MGAATLERPAVALSGGQRQKLRLVRLLADRPDLLLDEATLHLDLPSMERLEAALAGWPGTIVLVSHDRSFRSALARRTLALDAPEEDG